LEGVYEDASLDQQWTYQTNDGTIKSSSTGKCLHEQDPIFMKGTTSLLHETTQHFNFTLGGRAATTADCQVATKWDIGQYIGGSIVSRSSGLCLEVAKLEYIPEIQGKRIQTAPCQQLKKDYYDIREHQSWVNPNGIFKNLYQRQCLTIDRDAYPGIEQEVWSAPLADGSISVLAINKGFTTKTMKLTIDMLGLDTKKSYRLRDLWSQSNLVEILSNEKAHSFVVKSHASVMLKVTAI